ncbi:MAG: hypothetical protein WCG87_03885 [Bacteroidota bacterium]
MLIAIVFFIYTFITCFYTGKLVSEKLLKVSFDNQFHYIGIGIISITAIGRVLSLFITVSWIFQIGILQMTIASVRNGKDGFIPNFIKNNKLLLAIALIIIGFFCSQQSISYDEALYHSSFIAWLNDYGIVKGLGNLHGRLAFDSNWHLFDAIYNFKGLLNQPLNIINGFFLLWILCFFLNERAIRMSDESVKTLSVLAIIFLFFPVVFVYHVIDPSADYVSIFWTFLLLYEVYFFRAKNSHSSMLALVGITVIFLITIKLSVAILVLLGLSIFIDFKATKKYLLPICIIACVIVLPWLASNYLISGYIVYPYININALHPIWKVPDAIAAHEMVGIQYAPFGRWLGMDLDTVKQLDALTRYKLFLVKLRTPDKLMLFAPSVLFLFALLKSLKKEQGDLYKGLAILTAFAGYVIVLVSAPDFRFAAGYIYFILVVVLIKVRFRIPIVVAYLACVAQILVAVKLYAHLKPLVVNPSTHRSNGITFNFMLPEKYPHCPHSTTVIDGQSFYLFNEQMAQFNWDEIPAMYTPANNIHLIGGTLKEGFYTRPSK